MTHSFPNDIKSECRSLYSLGNEFWQNAADFANPTIPVWAWRAGMNDLLQKHMRTMTNDLETIGRINSSCLRSEIKKDFQDPRKYILETLKLSAAS